MLNLALTQPLLLLPQLHNRKQSRSPQARHREFAHLKCHRQVHFLPQPLLLSAKIPAPQCMTTPKMGAQLPQDPAPKHAPTHHQAGVILLSKCSHLF